MIDVEVGGGPRTNVLGTWGNAGSDTSNCIRGEGIGIDNMDKLKFPLLLKFNISPQLQGGKQKLQQ